MKFLFTSLILCLYSLASRAQETFRPLQALAGGSWVMPTKKGFIGERWEKVNEGELRSQGFKVTGSDTTFLEKVQLLQKKDGIYYISTVPNENGGLPVPFRLTNVKGHQFTFSNPEHDYPQFIVYDIISTDSLHAWTDGKNNGKDLKVDFYYGRRH